MYFSLSSTDHLEHLVYTKHLPEVLTIFPVKYVNHMNEAQNIATNSNDNHSSSEIIVENIENISLANQLLNDEFVTSHNGHNDESIDIEQNKQETFNKNDHAIFTHYLKLAIDLDRSERLSEMIRTTGFQLYNTFIGVNEPHTESVTANTKFNNEN